MSYVNPVLALPSCRKLRPLALRFWSKVLLGDGCWVWQASRNAKGYGQLNAGSRGRPLLAHRVSWELRFGPTPPGVLVLHTCDNPPCVKPGHLYLGDDQANANDRVERGRARNGRSCGENAGTAKLTVAAVEAIRVRASDGASISQLARDYGVARSTIRAAVNGKTWWDAGHLARALR